MYHSANRLHGLNRFAAQARGRGSAPDWVTLEMCDHEPRNRAERRAFEREQKKAAKRERRG